MGYSRERLFNDLTPTYRTMRIVNGSTGVITESTQEREGRGTIVHIMDNNNAPYRLRRLRGELIFSDAYISRTTFDYDSGSITIGDANWRRTDTGNLTYLIALPVEDPFAGQRWDPSDQCLIEAFAKMNKTPIVSGEILKDLNETLGMMRSPLKKALSLAKKLASGKPPSRSRRRGSGALSIADATASSWLEYRYGWKPLMMDIEESIKLTHKMRDKRRKLLVARVGKSVSWNNSKTTGPTYVHPQVGIIGTATVSRKKRCHAGVLYEVRPRTTSEELLVGLGLLPSDVPSTAWECIPLSFVADWFVGVGDWLNAIKPQLGVSPLGWWTTLVDEAQSSFTASTAYESPEPSELSVFRGSLGAKRITSYSMSRVCNKPLSRYPVLRVEPLSALHQADALGLIVGKINNCLSTARRR